MAEPIRPTTHRPFLIEHRRLNETPADFLPDARIHITPQARTSGLLRKLSGNQARILLAVFTYLTPNGQLYVTASQVAKAIGVPTPVAALWLWRFSRVRFKGEPVMHMVERELGHNVFTIAHTLVKHVSLPPRSDLPVAHGPGSRETIVRRSRGQYARPIQEVLPIIMQQLGHHPEEALDTPEAKVWEELRHLKIGREDIAALIATFGVERILQQVAWLPERYTKNRAKTLVTSLLNNAGPPRRIRDVLASRTFAAGKQGNNHPAHGQGQEGEHD